MSVASLSAFRYHPDDFFNWLQPLVSKILGAEPNPAHAALTKLQASGYFPTIITQNIDSFHQKAGSMNVIELHGSLDELVCPVCAKRFMMNEYIDSWFKEQILPQCKTCKTFLKPDIVLYEELLPPDAWEQAEFACDNTDLIFIAGTSLEVMPASGLPFRCVQNHAKTIIMNLSPTYLDPMADILLPIDVATGLPEIYRRIFI
jgi:NAD-dependent deacetylase